MRHSAAFLVYTVWDLSPGEKNYGECEVREAYTENKTGSNPLILLLLWNFK